MQEHQRQRSDERRYESWDRMNYACQAQSHGPSRSPTRSPTHRRPPSHYQSLSPASRAQAIARGQRELMEMVKNMPESCYELSLKDLVEHNHRAVSDDDRNDASSETELLGERREEVGGHEKGRSAHYDAACRGGARVNASGSGQGQGHHHGHMLKMVFPVSFGPRRKKKAVAVTLKEVKKSEPCANLGGGCSKIDEGAHSATTATTTTTTIGSLLGSPRGGGGNSNHNVGGGVDKEWWKKRYSGEESGGDGLSSSSNSGGSKSSSNSGSRSSSLTSRSNSNNTRHVSGNGGGCWWFMGRRIKSKDDE